VVQYVSLRTRDRKIDTLRNSGARRRAASSGSDALLAALRDPRRYPHPVGEIELIETHISWVLLTGRYAYKLKKPLDLGADASQATLDVLSRQLLAAEPLSAPERTFAVVIDTRHSLERLRASALALGARARHRTVATRDGAPRGMTRATSSSTAAPMRGTWTFGLLAALFFFFGALSIVLALSFFLTSKSAVHEVIAALFLLGGGVLVIGAAIVLQLRRIEKILA
jgi:hypothetical protein